MHSLFEANLRSGLDFVRVGSPKVVGSQIAHPFKPKLIELSSAIDCLSQFCWSTDARKMLFAIKRAEMTWSAFSPARLAYYFANLHPSCHLAPFLRHL